MSDIAKVIDSIVKDALVKPLKADGYCKKGRNFHLVKESSTRAVNVQASQGNFGDSGRFTLNLGVYLPAVAALLGHEVQKGSYPRESECTIRERIGALMPNGRDAWWEIGSETDLSVLTAEVQGAWLRHGKPWLDQAWDDLRKARHLLVEHHRYEAAIAASFLLGESSRATDLAREGSDWFSRNDNNNAASWILRRAKELETAYHMTQKS